MSISGHAKHQVSKRSLTTSPTTEAASEPLSQLPGVWKNSGQFQGHGWNMSAQPFASGEHGYRLLNNQYNETLTFQLPDKSVPNRGANGSQEVFTIEYVQAIEQIAAADFPNSGLAGEAGLAIHHAPGLWLHRKNHPTGEFDVGRLSSIAQGNAVMALGRSQKNHTGFDIPSISGLPIGINQDLQSPYLKPYLHFHEHLFQGVFDPTKPNELLNQAILPFFEQDKVASVTQLKVDSASACSGVNNIPFITRAASAGEVSSIFWIYELKEMHLNGEPKMLLQYTQTVLLEFFESPTGAGLIKWPQVSINTLEKQPNK
ncbi:heme-binding protein [Pseudoalteromonas byunsanensis]|uniref:Uncharacterized protein n=1 Tax=Pseudoalteromonas byunsanensis TaxID=327939 RepID=A0A1S1N254_9GAMM|nr:heme-binding protein [Pseudoalteromonas byunsanensis]OHU93534.1 hypothetical protein BIW53_19510 [Pseudoalteromonas byunsanensis]